MVECDIPAAWATIALGTVLASAVKRLVTLQQAVAVGADGAEVAFLPL